MTMRLLVLGATGRVGTHVVDIALERGHAVTAFVRSPKKITRTERALTVIEGDPMSVDPLARALPGHDAVVSALGRSGREGLRPSTLLAESAASTVAAMNRAGVRRLAIVSAAILFPEKGVRFAFFRWLLRHPILDLIAMEAVVRATELEWTIARPPRLLEAPDASYRSAHDALPPNAWSMSFRAVAAFVVDALEERSHAREVVGLARGGR